jgi:multidrug efflux pump subunit AcrA (membrane-fusion protein)
LHIPAQAVFEREGRRIVYVKSGSGFEPRPITTSKRSESVFVVSDGLKRGEVIALADPTVKHDNNSQQKKGGAMGALPVGAQ